MIRVESRGTVREPEGAVVDVHDGKRVADLARSRQLHRRRVREETGQVELERLLPHIAVEKRQEIQERAHSKARRVSP